MSINFFLISFCIWSVVGGWTIRHHKKLTHFARRQSAIIQSFGIIITRPVYMRIDYLMRSLIHEFSSTKYDINSITRYIFSQLWPGPWERFFHWGCWDCVGVRARARRVCVCVRARIQTEDLSVVKHRRSEDFWQSEDVSLRFFTRLTLEGATPIPLYNTILALNVQNKNLCVIFFFF